MWSPPLDCKIRPSGIVVIPQDWAVSAMIKDIFTLRVEQRVLKYASFNPEEWKDAGFSKVSEPLAATMDTYTR